MSEETKTEEKTGADVNLSDNAKKIIEQIETMSVMDLDELLKIGHQHQLQLQHLHKEMARLKIVVIPPLMLF